jgi:hypothetical protein
VCYDTEEEERGERKEEASGWSSPRNYPCIPRAIAIYRTSPLR